MHRLILWWGIIYFVALLFPVRIFASDVVINEIYANPENEDNEFIELYNNSEEEQDLNNWKISDLVKTYTISDSKISGKDYLVLNKSTTGIALNNSNEEISLIDTEDSKIDSFSYEDTIEGKSWSRVPDGTGSFENNTNVTEGDRNSSPPTPTPTTTPSPVPTKEPTKTPINTKSPTATIAEDSSLQANDDNNSPTENSINLISTPSTSNNIMDDKNESREDNDVEGVEGEDSTPSYIYSITTGFGMLILACGILLFRKFKDRNEEDDF